MITNTNRRNFLGGLAASLALGGCRTPWWYGERPALMFGVISDIHVTTPESTAEFRRALAYFRDRGVDAVLVAGDLADWGLKSGLKAVADAWFDVFPDNRAPDGRTVEKLFVTGNHDFDGWWYGDMTLDMHVQGYCEDEACARLGMKACWEEAFREPYADIRSRTVKGFTFVSSEWHVDGKEDGDEAVAKWLGEHAAELKGEKPFFYFRHSPLANTVSSSRTAKGAVLTDAFRQFPNAVTFNGHTHWTLNDERSIWQEEFTAVSIPSMSYTSMPRGYENGSDSRRADSKLGMRRLPSRDGREEAQGYVVSVYADRMELERRDFEHMCEAAAPWVVPLGAGRAKPYEFGTHAAATPVPQFPADAAVKTYVTNTDTRNARWTIFMTLEFPAAAAEGGRVYDYEVRAEMEADGAVVATKRFLSPGFYKLPGAEPASLKFHFDAMDLPERGRYRLKVYPRNCFGACGRPIASRVLESKPGKATPWYKH